MVNPKVYPITAKLEADLIDAGIDLTENNATIRIIRTMVETMNAYEHEADVEDVFQEIDAAWIRESDYSDEDDRRDASHRVQMLAYAAVTYDQILAIYFQS